MDTSKFSEDYKDLVNDVAEYDKEHFNIFNVLRLERYEIRHSNFIQWLFGNREFAKAFLKKFAEEAKLGNAIANAPIQNVEREQAFYEVDENNELITRYKKEKKTYYSNSIEPKKVYELPKNDGSGKVKIIYQDNIDLTGIKPEKVRRFIDINIVTDTFTLTIENKIDTGEHSLQCVAYRNYMLNNPDKIRDYKDKDHYFVLLAKDKPKDFNKEGTDETTGRYPGYVYMDYNMIRKILVEDDEVKNSFSSESGQDKAVAQYAQMIDEWTNLPDELVEICKKIRNFEPFAEKAQYDELMKSEELTEAEKRFADVARRYYLIKLKKKYDEKIKSALEAISRVPIKDDYAGGKYAYSINLPNLDEEKYARGLIWLGDDLKLTEEDYKRYKSLKRKKKKNLKDDDQAFKKSIQEVIEKAKKRYKVMNTVDYRAPMAGYNNPHIAFLCGLHLDFSRTLCMQLVNNEDSLKKLDDMKKSGNWDIAFTYCRGDGAGYTGGNKGYHCYADLSAVRAAVRKNTDLLDQFMGQHYFDEVLSNEYLGYLRELKKMNVIADYDKNKLKSSDLKTKKDNNHLFSVSGFVENILNYFLNNKEGIKKSLEAIDKILETKMYQEDFNRFFEKKAHPIFDDSKDHKEILKELDYLGVKISDDRLKTMQDAVKIALFNKWFQSGKNAPCCPEVKDIIEALKNAKSLAELTNENAQVLASNLLVDETPKSEEKKKKKRKKKNEDKDENESSLYTALKAKTYQVNKRITLCWHLVMVYCLSDDESATTENLGKAFRSHTLEGAKVFGFDYDERFKNEVFKPEESETEDSN